MTTFSGQSCVLGTAESCGLRLEECGALGFVLTLIGQEMGSMLAAAVFWLGVSQRWRALLVCSVPCWFATTALANGNRAYPGCQCQFFADPIFAKLKS